ncbi:MAG: hypothetical protein ABEJ26_01315 [Halosimplex sp.]
MRDVSETGEGAQREEGSDDADRRDEDPPIIGECAECERVYPLQVGADGELRPTGTGGVCDCGSEEFRPLSTE